MKSVEKQIHEWMIANRKTLALAESCTGGAIAARLTAIAGASEYFLGSIVVYSNLLKQKVLHVSEEILKKEGAVSQEAVKAMLEGVLTLTGADFGIAITGFAGPTGDHVGTIWLAVGKKGQETVIEKLELKGDRRAIINSATQISLDKLWRLIS